jgi:hypothetical protein
MNQKDNREQPKKVNKMPLEFRGEIANGNTGYANLAPLPNKRNHLIYSYFIECTGIVEVFRALFRSYMITDELLKLNRQVDRQLIEILKETMTAVFPKPESRLIQDQDQLRYNAYWRLFGYTIKGRENNFPKVSSSYNREFNSTFESIMYNISQGILDKDITTEKLGNPNAIAELLENLGRQLRSRTNNEIEDLSEYSAYAFYRLILLLENDHLMTLRLGIKSTDPSRRLIELGEKVRVHVAKETIYLFLLAASMNIFLRTIEDTLHWDAAAAAALYEDPGNEKFFKEISAAWYQITGKDFVVEALRSRSNI